MNNNNFFIIDYIDPENCYKTEIPQVLPVEITRHLGGENQKSTCIAACKDYKYAGMEAGNMCFCGDILPAPALKRPGECKSLCSGDTSEMCGGHWRMSIFDVPSKFTVLL